MTPRHTCVVLIAVAATGIECDLAVVEIVNEDGLLAQRVFDDVVLIRLGRILSNKPTSNTVVLFTTPLFLITVSFIFKTHILKQNERLYNKSCEKMMMRRVLSDR